MLLLLITLVVDIERLVIRSWHPFLIVLVDFLLFLQGWGALRQTRKRGFEGLGQQVSGRCHSPNRTPPLDQRSRFYAIVKCEGISVPVIYRSSASYWAAIRSLEGSDSISQSFPSELEAKIYVEAAGFSGEVSVLA